MLIPLRRSAFAATAALLALLLFLDLLVARFSTVATLVDWVRQSGPAGVKVLDAIDSTAGRIALLLFTWASAYAAFASARPPVPRMVMKRARVTKPTDIRRVELINFTGGFITGQKPLGRDVVVGTARFGEVEIANESDDPAEAAIGRDVAATVDFFRPDGTPACEQLPFGRWADRPHPTDRVNLREVSVLDFPPNGVRQSLNVALKPTDSPNCYAFGNETIIAYPKNGWRDKRRVLPPGTYFVRINLRGINVKAELWLRLNNPADSEGFEMAELRASPIRWASIRRSVSRIATAWR